MQPTPIRTDSEIATTPTSPNGDAGSPTGQMRAVVQDRYGAADVLELRTIERPEIASDQVLVEVHAAGVDRGVWHLMTGQPYLIRIAGYGITKPKNPVLGLDVAGRVVAVGNDVTRFRVGDEVFGIASGSYAEYAAADEDKLVHRPATITSQQAAAAAISGITALQALTDVGHLEAGQRVLIVGASGGVGTFAVQLAKALGGEVTGVCSTPKVEMVRSIGADHVIDYTVDDFVDDSTRYDLILDVGGRNSIARLRSVLAPTGTLVIVGGEDGGRWTGGVGRQVRAMLMSPFIKQRLTTFVSKEHHTLIERLAAHLESGAVVPTVGQEFVLEDVTEAIRQLEAGTTNGKSVIVVRAPAS